MHLDIPLLPLALLDLQPWMIAIILPVVTLVCGSAVAISAMFFHHRRQEMWHQTARVALEKGQPLPSMPSHEQPHEDPKADVTNDLRGGLVLVGTGIGLFGFLGSFIARPLGYVGAIPGFIGVALLISWLVRSILARKDPAKNGRPSQS